MRDQQQQQQQHQEEGDASAAQEEKAGDKKKTGVTASFPPFLSSASASFSSSSSSSTSSSLAPPPPPPGTTATATPLVPPKKKKEESVGDEYKRIAAQKARGEQRLAAMTASKEHARRNFPKMRRVYTDYHLKVMVAGEAGHGKTTYATIRRKGREGGREGVCVCVHFSR